MLVDRLAEWIEEKMRMSHVYQPLLIRTLAESGGAATIKHLARSFAAADEAQVAFYEKRIRAMPLRVLRRHGIVVVDGDVVRLAVDDMHFEGLVRVVGACNTRIADFLAQRGQGAWSGLLELNPVPETVRYDVLVRDRVCQLCGKGRDDDVLEVDHIVPRSLGGSNDPSNLQVLCRTCNRGKSNRDTTDLR